MKKFRLFATLLVVALCATTVFTSCRNDDDDENGGYFEIRATNVSGNTSGVTTVRAEIFDDSEENFFTVGEAPFQNNGFTLRLTNEIPASFLFPVAEVFPDNLVSDRSARITFEVIPFAFVGNEIKGFWLVDHREYKHFWTLWFFADRSVTIRGDGGADYVNLNFKRGWNTVYVYSNNSTGEYRVTSQRPAGANLQWRFGDYGF